MGEMEFIKLSLKKYKITKVESVMKAMSSEYVVGDLSHMKVSKVSPRKE